MKGGKINIDNSDRVDVVAEPGISYFQKRIIDKYGENLLKKITGSSILVEVENEPKKIQKTP